MKSSIVVCVFPVLFVMNGATAPAFAQVELVSRVKDALVARGQTFTTNCDAFEITRRVAWALRGQGALLIGKTPGQNGCDFAGQRFSHDAIAFLNAPWRDILRDAGPPKNTNLPAWNVTGSSAAPLYEPFDPGDVILPPVELPQPPPPPQSQPGLQQQILEELRAHEAAEAIDRGEAKAFREDVKTVWGSFGKPVLTFAGKYVVPAVVAFLGGRALAK